MRGERRMRNMLTKLKGNWRNPWWWQDGLMKRVLLPLLFRKNNGIYIFNEEWDYLIVLDACRYDTFKEIASEFGLEGKLEHRISRGSCTEEFLIENFSNRKFKDTILITSNPHVFKHRIGKSFFKTVPVWREGWIEDVHVVSPDYVYHIALKYYYKYPNKKLIIWFLQPHTPYIGLDFLIDDNQNIKSRAKRREAKFNPFLYYYKGVSKYISYDDKELYNSYKENLRWVMHYVKKLVDTLSGKIVITSDHGEAFGEKLHPLIPVKVYFHPAKTRVPVLVKVPWFVIEKDRDRKQALKSMERNRIKNVVESLKQSGKI